MSDGYLGTSIEAKSWARQRTYGPKMVQRPKTGMTEEYPNPYLVSTQLENFDTLVMLGIPNNEKDEALRSRFRGGNFD